MNVTSNSFPYGESILWYSPETAASLPHTPLKNWLLSNGSLTEKLKKHCNNFSVTVLGEHLLSPLLDELPSQSEPVWVREVLLSLDDVPWVFARTLIPQALLDNTLYDFINLGNRPLGELLFTHNEIVPGKIEVAAFKTCGRLAKLATSLSQSVDDTLWGRRRYFHIGTSELIVSEIFLPAAVENIKKYRLD
ncbi:chorismate--pyruvate lyase family protein [Shewanella sp. OMA3-2]|uniref:chorismate--pyruvate lyase family protein n=1 Tax=Shewanella sp. OMA3-2 TaxID=2908650 RepID=UPI001F001E80|nr:chorismate lyase [Shewanella sp. OMA3-2]UJF22209.1 chorismate lyase [Shewanella sp. OMA3-2]